MFIVNSYAYSNGRGKMNNYVDQYGRYHDAPVTVSEPIPSNNGWIYTAYAQKMGLPVDFYKLKYCYEFSEQDGVLWRSPGKALPPMSRDEILGMVALGFTPNNLLETWNFSPFPLPKFDITKFVPQLIELVKHRDDRNYFWKNNLDQIYRFAFSVPLADRHFILQKHNKFNIFYWAISKIDSMFSGASGINYLKYGNSVKAMQEEFPEDHPLRTGGKED